MDWGILKSGDFNPRRRVKELARQGFDRPISREEGFV